MYHGRDRTMCPHALGWKAGRAKVFSLQTGGVTSEGQLPSDLRQCWRSMFVDEIEMPVMTDEPWVTADNYLQNANGLDEVEFEVELK